MRPAMPNGWAPCAPCLRRDPGRKARCVFSFAGAGQFHLISRSWRCAALTSNVRGASTARLAQTTLHCLSLFHFTISTYSSALPHYAALVSVWTSRSYAVTGGTDVVLLEHIANVN